MLRRNLDFVVKEWRMLAFGLSFQFFSCFGRTFYIALFSPDIRGAFELTPGEFSYIYSAATLLGVLLIPWLGRMIDEVDLRVYAAAMVIVLSIASVTLSATSSLIVLFVALFGFRVTGGSMMNHASVVTLARHFDKRRGTATAICSLGVPLAEAVLPALAVLAISVVGWRATWGYSGLVLCVVFVPLIFLILRPVGHAPVDRAVEPSEHLSPSRSATRREAMRDPKFYALAPVLILPTPLVTALFFHHATIAETKAWTLEWLATCFAAYAAATVVASLAAGPLVDRYSARAVLPWTIFPMIVGLAFLAYGSSPLTALVYMLGVGVTTGARYSLTAAVWAEIYGTRHLGSIRSVVHAVNMLLFGLSPAALGWSIDHGVAIDSVVQIFIGLLVASAIVVKLASPRTS